MKIFQNVLKVPKGYSEIHFPLYKYLLSPQVKQFSSVEPLLVLQVELHGANSLLPSSKNQPGYLLEISSNE